MTTIGTQTVYPVGDAGESPFHPEEGLTKREYFAALALNGMLSTHIPTAPNDTADILRAKLGAAAVALADALIAALNETKI